VFAVDALKNIVALIAGFLAACGGDLLKEARSFTLGGRHDLDVSDRVGRSSRWGLRHGGRDDPHDGGRHQPSPKNPPPFSPWNIAPLYGLILRGETYRREPVSSNGALAGGHPFHQAIELPPDIVDCRLPEIVRGRPVHKRTGCARLHIVVERGAPDCQRHTD